MLSSSLVRQGIAELACKQGKSSDEVKEFSEGYACISRFSSSQQISNAKRSIISACEKAFCIAACGNGWVYTGEVLYGRYKEIARFSWLRGKNNEDKSPPPLWSYMYFVYPLAMRLHVGCCDQLRLRKEVTLTFQVRAWSDPRKQILEGFCNRCISNCFEAALTCI